MFDTKVIIKDLLEHSIGNRVVGGEELSNIEVKN